MQAGRRHFLSQSAALALAAGCSPRPPAPPIVAPPRVRSVADVVAALPVTDGAGVRLARALGQPRLPMLDPFLMLDEFRTENPGDYVAGFPWHPHRGFETVTYMLDGAMEHEDSLGNRGRLVAGSAQWMTAGNGIIHQEMPKQVSGLMHGYQLWVNLPARSKRMAPRYQDIVPGRIPTVEHEDARVRVVAGTFEQTVGPVAGIVTEPRFLDVTLEPRGRVDLPVSTTCTAFAFLVEGEARLGASGVVGARGQVVVFGRDGDTLRVRTDAGARLLVLAGEPIGEPVARRGPFVMNTDAELQQAFDDYRSGRLTVL